MDETYTFAQQLVLKLAIQKEQASFEFLDSWGGYDDYSDGSGGYYDAG